MALQTIAATAAQSFVDSIGVNTHIDFTQTAYGNFGVVQSALAFLGVKNVRDAYQNVNDGALFTSLHQDLGIRFDLFIGPLPDGPEPYAVQLQQIESLPAGVVAFVEGVNESDIFGRSLTDATAFQQTLYNSVHATMPGIPVIQLSFGNIDDYGITGDQSAFADYANAHTFFGSGNNPAFQDWIGTLNADALRATPGKPIIVTESGYTTSGSTTNQHVVVDSVQAKYTLDIPFDTFKAGDARTYIYELLDEHTGTGNNEDTFGLFFSDGTPKPSGIALHNLISLLSDPGAATAPAPSSLTYSLGGLPSTGDSLLLQKSDGSFWLAVWNDVRLSGPSTPTPITVPSVPMTLSLAAQYGSIQVFDPLNDTMPIASYVATDGIAFSLPDHPVLLRIAGPAVTPAPGPHLVVPAGASATAGTTNLVNAAQITDAFAAANPGSMFLSVGDTTGALSMTGPNGTALPGSGSHTISFSGTFAQVNAALATLAYTAGTTPGGDNIAIEIWDQAGLSTTGAIPVTVAPPPPPPPGPNLSVPTSESVAAGGSVAVTGILISDSFAATNPGTMALSVSDSAGRLTMLNASGAALPGSGTSAISFNDTLAQLNAALATLTYVAGSAAGNDAISIGVWDQQGLFSSDDIPVSVTGAVPSGPSLAVPATEEVPVGTSIAVDGARLQDTFAAGNPGAMALNVSVSAGSIGMRSESGTPLTGSGSRSISFSGTYVQVNAALASLTYMAGTGAGADTIVYDVWDQAGVEFGATTAVTVSAGALASITQAALQLPASPAFAVDQEGETAPPVTASDGFAQHFGADPNTVSDLVPAPASAATQLPFAAPAPGASFAVLPDHSAGAPMMAPSLQPQ